MESSAKEALVKKLEAKRGTMAAAKEAMVVSESPMATQAGLEELKAGGNAMDAFVAAAFAAHAAAQGYTSLAGTMGVLYYEANSGKTYYLDASFDVPKNGLNGFDPAKDRASGKSVLIPGTVAGLEAASKRFGRRPWKEVMAPAIRLAREGFPISPLYAWTIGSRRAILERSDYGKSTFFKDGEPLKAGEILKQPALARTLEDISSKGSAYMYRGAWARDFVAAVNGHGGDISAAELRAYRVRWLEPLKGSYRGYEVETAPPPVRGGINLLLGLKMLESLDLKKLGHWTASADALAGMVEIYRAVQAEPWIWGNLKDRAFVADHLSNAYAQKLWGKIKAGDGRRDKAAFPGTHSGHIVVVDRDGNIATGTHTIESLPWGDNGIFVGGIPLNSAAPIALGYHAQPGGRMYEAYAPHIVFKDGKPILAAGTIASSLFPCNLEVLANVLDFGMNLEDALLAPRFGMYSFDLRTYSIDKSSNLLDPRFGDAIVKELAAKGLKFDQEGQGGYVDTGMWYGVQIERGEGKIYGMSSEQAHGLAAGW